MAIIKYEYTNFTEYRDENNQYNRLDGPSVIWNDGTSVWYKDNKLHRLDGPAVEFWYGVKEYWINGIEYTEQDFKFIRWCYTKS